MTFYAYLFATGLLLGRLSAVWSAKLVDASAKPGLTACRACAHSLSIRELILWYPGRRCVRCGNRDGQWPIWVSIWMAFAFSGFAWLLLHGVQTVTEVRPAAELWENRLPFHLLCLLLLTTAAVTDYLDYVVPDQVVVTGMCAAVFIATVSGELQMIHVWVDWDYELVRLYGPWLPEWMKQYQRLHGLIWSIAGLLTGGSLMWGMRIGAERILGIPAVGFGDVTLMAMIGAFLGWQPTLCVLAIAPIVGILMATGSRMLTGRSFVAFGPYLCFAAIVVMCSWTFLWDGLRLKILFSHWPTILAMVTGSFVMFCLLLAAVKWFRGTSIDQLR